MAKKVKGLEKGAGWLLALGVMMLFFGFAIVLFPVAGTFAVEILFGLILLIAGISQVVFAFTVRGWGGFLLTLIAGLLYAAVGLLLLIYPLAGAITLTMLLGLFLLVAGALKIILSFGVKPEPHWGWLLFNGVITILLGLLILAAWPSDATWVIGLLFGIDMMFGGLTFLVLSSAARR